VTLLASLQQAPPEARAAWAERLADLPPDKSDALLRAVRQEVLLRCQTDGWFWTAFVRTKDEADPAESTKAFPQQLDYVRAYWALMATKPRLAVAKSRQMLVTWATCAYMVWVARFHPNTAVLYQTQSEDDANGMVSVAGSTKDGGYFGRCQFIERHLPPWMQLPVRDPEGQLTYPNGSIIRALPGGANKIRGKTGTLIVLDEMAFLEEAKASYTAIAPLVQKGAQLIAISTPNGGAGNFFYHLWHGLALDAVTPVEAG
jgi:hypothetical protein